MSTAASPSALRPDVAGQAAPEGPALLIATAAARWSPDADADRQRHRPASGCAAAHRGPRPAERRRPARRRPCPSALRLPWPAAAAVALVLLLKRECGRASWPPRCSPQSRAPPFAALLRYVFGSIDQNVWGVAAGLTLGLLAAGLSMLGWVRCSARRSRRRRAAGAAARQPAVRLEQRAGDAADRLGHPWSVVTAGRHRDAPAIHRILRRCRHDGRDRGADLLGSGRRGTHRDRRCSPGRSAPPKLGRRGTRRR